MRLPDVVLRLLGRPTVQPVVERADRILNGADMQIRVTVGPKRESELRASARRAQRRLAGR